MLKVTKNLKIIRNKAGFSQQAISERLFMDQATYSTIEAGKADVKIETALAISNVLGVDLQEFCQISGQIVQIANNTFNQSSIYGDINCLSDLELIGKMKNLMNDLQNSLSELNNRINKTT
jgi:transcriptional regulator with XRE-family HTH domain